MTGRKRRTAKSRKRAASARVRRPVTRANGAKKKKTGSDSQERFDLALQSLSVGVWDWDLDTTELYWSPKYRQMLGIADKDFVPSREEFLNRLHPEDQDAVSAALESHLREGTPFDVECRMHHVDGHYLWVRFCGLVQRDAHGRGRRMVGSVDDISIRKLAEQKLSEREARLRNMFERTIDGLLTIDTRGIIQSYNPACERIFGYTAGEAIGKNVGILMPEPEHSEHDRYINNYLQTGEAKVIGIDREVEGRRSDGSTFPMELSISEFKAGGQAFFTGVVRDITQRKQVERMKSEFISVVSHELRTPLTSIRGSLDLLARGRDAGMPAQALELLEIARRNSERLVVLINDILDIEKLESGKMRVQVQPVGLHDLLTDAVIANAAYAARFGVSLNLHVEPNIPPVLADPDRLTQIIANLLSNAAKFTRQGSDVDLRAERLNHNVRISVRDYGDGVPEQLKATIFEKFSQGDHSNSRERTGTGLGLSIARNLARLMNGDIAYVSEAGRGATFFVDLPIAGITTGALASDGWDDEGKSNGRVNERQEKSTDTHSLR